MATTDGPGRPAGADPADDAALELEILSGRPTAEEVAAVTAVLSAMAEDMADADRELALGTSAWERSQRTLRSPIVPGPHAWSGFTG